MCTVCNHENSKVIDVVLKNVEKPMCTVCNRNQKIVELLMLVFIILKTTKFVIIVYFQTWAVGRLFGEGVADLNFPECRVSLL